MNPNTEHNHFSMHHFMGTYTRNSKTTGRIYADVVRIKWLLYYGRCLFIVLKFNERY